MKNFKRFLAAFSIMTMLICSGYYSTAQVTNWRLIGNSGINPSLNFIGTTDNQPLKFRINNFPAGELNPVNGNTALGMNTLLLNTTGISNVAIGTNALYHNTRGRNLVAVGDSALFNHKILLPIAANTAIGSKTLFSATGARQSTAIGFEALYSSFSGFDNTATGFRALYSTNASANSNTAIGSKSLYANTTGSRNTAIGAFADVGINGLTNATAIGYGAIVSTSNSLVLGNGANVGIGTSSPNTKLQVNGGYIRITEAEAGTNLRLGGLYGTTGIWSDAGALNIGAINGNPIILQASGSATGNVGIGTSSPNTKLQVNGGYIRITEAEAGTNLRLGGLYGTTGIWSDAGALNIGAINGNPIILQASGSATGNVGIGTVNPAYKLSVNGTIRSKEVRVETGWSDYVFDKDYKLRSLNNVAEYIEQYKHLPGIPSAKEIQKNGLAVGEVQTKMMEKIEELTLYIIEQEKSINKLKEQNAKLEAKMNLLIK